MGSLIEFYNQTKTMKEKGSNSRMFLAGFLAHLPSLNRGLCQAFATILLPQLQQPQAEIKATLEQGSWIASSFVIGDLFGSVLGGPLADRFGRRVAILLHCLPFVLGWLLTWQAQSLEHLYIAKVITGVGMGANVPIVSMYSREISTTKLRGTLGLLNPAFCNSGFLVMFILGAILPWRLATLPGAIYPL